MKISSIALAFLALAALSSAVEAATIRSRDCRWRGNSRLTYVERVYVERDIPEYITGEIPEYITREVPEYITGEIPEYITGSIPAYVTPEEPTCDIRIIPTAMRYTFIPAE